jgi:glutamine---fructose-6-phosphate transaminase (isomerizing)
MHEGNVAPLIKDGLVRLEYRGYDSVGIATISDSALHIKKGAGKIEQVDARVNLADLPGTVGMGHTRWATHGAPTDENAHPHVDCTGKIAVIHNGIIENFATLKETLTEQGHTFKSRTDTEVVAHLIEEEMKKGSKLEEAAKRTFKQIIGAFALVVVSSQDPEKVVCARNESPLLLGVSEKGNFCASDIPAFLPVTRRAIELHDGEMAVLTPSSYQISQFANGSQVTRPPYEVTWSPEMARKEGYPYFMLKEIHEQPIAVANTLRGRETYLNLLAIELSKADRVFLVACGTAYHSCLAGTYMFSKLAGVNATPVVASEFSELYGDSLSEDTAVVAVSQSGETLDTLGAVRFAKEHGAPIYSVTNTLGSSVTRLSNIYVLTQAGPEIGVAATKTFATQLATFALLAPRLAQRNDRLDNPEGFLKELRTIPALMEEVIKKEEASVKRIAAKYAYDENFYFLGRGVSAATALEGALKLKEISYTHAEGYPAGESKHGPIALVKEDFPCLFISPKDSTRGKLIGNIMEMKARGARIIAVHEKGDSEITELADDSIEIPQTPNPILSPLVSVVPVQMLAYYAAVERGYDPDKPRNLAKSVTVA